VWLGIYGKESYLDRQENGGLNMTAAADSFRI